MTVDQHYQQQLDTAYLLSQVEQILGASLQPEQLAPIDQLHLGGLRASRQLLQQIALQPQQRVLDVGCGLGGTSRLIAAESGCQVTGIDLTADFCYLAEQLSQRLATPLTVNFVQGDGQRLPFADASFDAVVSQHCLMNLPDPLRALKDFHRVLRRDGTLLLHEVIAGNGDSNAMRYPVPWASNASQSFLMAHETLCDWLQQAGFELQRFDDETATALQWRQHHSHKEQQGLSTLSPGLIYGERFSLLARNLLTNLQQDCVRIIQIVAVPARQ